MDGVCGPGETRVARVLAVLFALLPGALTVYLGFHAGGFFVGTQAKLAIVLIVVSAVRVMAATHPAEGWSLLLSVAVAALGLFAVWTIASGGWSHSPFRALASLEIVLPYVAALAVFGSVGRRPGAIRWMVRGMALATVIVCGAGLLTRLLPDVWPIVYPSLTTRLSYPVTYWNAFGLLAGLGVIICFGLTSDHREPPLVRVLAAAAVPILGSALLLTLSRGSIAACILGLVVFAIVGHPRSLLAGVVAAGPATAIAVAATYHADLLVSEDVLTRAARDQGEHVATVVAACVLGAAALRTVLLPGDAAVARMRLAGRARRGILGVGAVATIAALATAAVAVDVPRQYHRFVDDTRPAGSAQDPRLRLTGAFSTGRIEQWNIALKGFREQPLHGAGAGTYQLFWESRRSSDGAVRDAHSLYVEVMGELGIVGLVFVVAALLAILLGLARRSRGPNRALYATILAAGVSWAVAAGIDWHWEMPVVSLWLFALGGAALAKRPPREPPARSLAMAPRIAIAASACVLMVVVPLSLALSQDRLEAAYAEVLNDDCRDAELDAAAALDAVGSRPDALEILANCQSEAKQDARALRTIDEAVERDPDNWRPRYSKAVLLARARRDPRSAVRAALRRNPREPVVQEAVAAFGRTTSARRWQAIGRDLLLPVPPL